MNLNSDNLEPSTLQFKCFCEVFPKVVNLIYVPDVYCHVIILVVHLQTSSKLKIKKENILSLFKVIYSYNANQAGSASSKVGKNPTTLLSWIGSILTMKTPERCCFTLLSRFYYQLSTLSKIDLPFLFVTLNMYLSSRWNLLVQIKKMKH